MNARKSNPSRAAEKSATDDTTPPVEASAPAEAPPVEESTPEQPDGTAPVEPVEPVEPVAPAELAWCRMGRDIEENAPECPRHEFDPGTGLCNLHFVTRLDLREAARNDG